MSDRWLRVKHATKQPASHGSGYFSTFLEPIEPDRHDDTPDDAPPRDVWWPP